MRRFNPGTAINETSLKSIAKTTGGQYFRATDARELTNIYRLLDKLEPASKDQQFYRPIKPLYPWPLGTALLLSFLLALSHISIYRVKPAEAQ